MKKRIVGKILIVIITLVSLITLFFVEPISQDLAYHQFVDNRTLISVPHFWNVVSNIPFFIAGFYALARFNCMKIIQQMKTAYWLFFFGVGMVAFGSGYYHYFPSNETLVWDRLPMTIAFMSLFALIISEFIDEKKGMLLLVPFVLIGAASVFYWQWTESNGAGDLRFYAVVQFLPIILIPIILLCYSSKYTHKSGYWYLLLAYFLAKILEYFDLEIFQITSGMMSGHALKHVAAAIGVGFLYASYCKRKRAFLSS